MTRDLSHLQPIISGGIRKARTKELRKAKAMAGILAEAAEAKRAAGLALIQEADRLSCESWNERMWSEGGPAQPSPSIGQALNGGYSFLEVICKGCQKRLSVSLIGIKQPADTPIHRLETSLRHRACRRGQWSPHTILKQLAPQPASPPPAAEPDKA